MTGTRWAWWRRQRRVVQVIGEQTLFGNTTLTVVDHADDSAHRVSASEVGDLSERDWTAHEIRIRAHALQVLAESRGVTPLVANVHVSLLPHQEAILERALRLTPVRLAICCEVGLGKTTTAGAIIAELLAREAVRRVLVVAPKGVQLQWVAEMRDKFGLSFTRIGAEGVSLDAGSEVWRAFDLAVTSLDAIKPLRQRTGWDAQRVAAHNAARLHGAVDAGWDLVIVDEAHRVAGSTADVARHRLAVTLARETEHLLLLTATPHSGKSEPFRRLLGLIDDRFNQGQEVTTATVGAVVARTEKRSAVGFDGRPLFTARTTRLEVVSWEGHSLHRHLYDAVSEYVRDGYHEARATGQTARGFLLLLFQRLVASSAEAVTAGLERRLTNLRLRADSIDGSMLFDELADDDRDALLATAASQTEEAELTALLDQARRAQGSEPDPKAAHFLRLLRALRYKERSTQIKVLIFTEFRATQRAIARLLTGQGLSVVTIDGSMGVAERAAAQAAFSDEAQILVSTDAGSEGVNLQFAHVVVNWDLPWAPTQLEQRIGRVDRIGQRSAVKAFNLVLADSVDQRVLEVLEAKLDTILAELGADKRGDVLASSDSLVDALYVAAITDGASLESAGDQFDALARSALLDSSEGREVLRSVATAPGEAHFSPVPGLVRELDAATGGRALDHLRQVAVIAPGEPVPVLQGRPRPSWLVAVRIGSADSRAHLAAVALSIDDNGRVDPREGRALLGELAHGSTQPTGRTLVLSPGEHRRLLASAEDYCYQALRDIGGGEVPVAPAIDLGLLVRCE